MRRVRYPVMATLVGVLLLVPSTAKAVDPPPALITVTPEADQALSVNEIVLHATGTYAVAPGRTLIEVRVAFHLYDHWTGAQYSQTVTLTPGPALAGGKWNTSAYVIALDAAYRYEITVQNAALVFRGTGGLVKSVTAW